MEISSRITDESHDKNIVTHNRPNKWSFWMHDEVALTGTSNYLDPNTGIDCGS